MSKGFKIKFELVNEFGSEYVQSSTIENFEVYDSELTFIGEQLNCFLRQCGYVRRDDYMLMEDMTEEEVEALTDYLYEMRKSHADTDES